MSFTYYRTRTIFELSGDDPAMRASQILWLFDSLGRPDPRAAVEAQVELCPRETTLPAFFEHLPKDQPILDAGCGLARWVLFLRRRGYRAFGVDFSAQAIQHAARTDPGAPLAVGDAQRLPLRDACLGGVLSFGVIEHDPHGPQRALHELLRVLRPGGVALISVPYNNLWRRLVVNQARRWRDWRKRRAGLSLEFGEYRFTARELAGFLRQAGFVVESLHPDEFRPPLAKGLWVDSPTFFGYVAGNTGLPSGRSMWELNRRGLLLQRFANQLSPWLVAGGVMAVARRPQ